MKNVIFCLFFILSGALKSEMIPVSELVDISEDTELLDKIKYIIYGQENETIVLCQSDLERSSIDGRQLTDQEWLLMWALYLDAKRLKVDLSEDDIDKMLQGVQKEYKLSVQKLKSMFKDAGYTWKEARQQLRVMQMGKIRLDHEISSSAPDKIDEQLIRTYYDQHPIVIEGCYTLQRAVIPFDNLSIEQQKDMLEEKIKAGQTLSFSWLPPYTLGEKELTSDFSFIHSMKEGDISVPVKSASGFEVIKLVKKVEPSLVPYQERRGEILALLRQEKINTVIEQFNNKLLEKTKIIVFS